MKQIKKRGILLSKSYITNQIVSSQNFRKKKDINSQLSNLKVNFCNELVTSSFLHRLNNVSFLSLNQDLIQKYFDDFLKPINHKYL